MILVTGGNGFIGTALVQTLSNLGRPVKRLTRTDMNAGGKNVTTIVGDLSVVDRNWFNGVTTIVHTAAITHVHDKRSADGLAKIRKINVEGTMRLAREAARADVKRFIFLSSVKVNGEESKVGCPLTEKDHSDPQDAYSVSKYEAEKGLRKLAHETNMEVVIIRPPLVYGPGVKGNFESMIKWVGNGIPLPLGAVFNQRSLVALDNLVDFVITCIDHPAAANETFFVADGEDISTTELLEAVGKAMEKPSRLLPVSIRLLRIGAAMLGKKAVMQRLLGSMQVDISKAHQALGWTPPVSLGEGLKRAMQKSERLKSN